MADKKCTIALVKAHIGPEGYEVADEAARQGAENKDCKKTCSICNKKINYRQYNRTGMEKKMGKYSSLQTYKTLL